MGKATWVDAVERVEKPWGFETHFAVVPGKYCGKMLHVRRGEALSLQYHERKEETVAVQSGKLWFEVGMPDEPLDGFEIASWRGRSHSPGRAPPNDSIS